MDVIAKARELGAALQQDERYTKLMEAQKANEADTALNELIAKIQLVQMSFQHEAAKEDKNARSTLRSWRTPICRLMKPQEAR